MPGRWADLHEGPGLLASLWRFRVVLVAAALAGVVVGLATVVGQPVRYEASVRLVLPEPTRDARTGRPSADPIRVLLNQTALLQSQETMSRAARRHGDGMTAAA